VVMPLSVSQAAQFLTDKMHASGWDRHFRGRRRGISAQVVNNMIDERIIPGHVIGGYKMVMREDLDAMKFKLVGAARRDPVLYCVPRDMQWPTVRGMVSSEEFVVVDGEMLPVTDCLTADEIMAEFVRRENADPHDVAAMRRLDARARRYARDRNFVGSFRVRRNWLVPVAIKDGVAYALFQNRLTKTLEPFAFKLA
jgi:hypothetical protein